MVDFIESVGSQACADIRRHGSAAGIVDGQTFCNRCVWNEFRDGGQALPQPDAAVATKRYTRLACKVILLQEGGRRQRERRPQVEISQQKDFSAQNRYVQSCTDNCATSFFRMDKIFCVKGSVVSALQAYSHSVSVVSR